MDGKANAIDHYGIVFGIMGTFRPLTPTFLGLELARLADLPADVLTEAWRVSTKLKAQDDALQAASESNATAARRKIILRVRPFTR